MWKVRENCEENLFQSSLLVVAEAERCGKIEEGIFKNIFTCVQITTNAKMRSPLPTKNSCTRWVIHSRSKYWAMVSYS